MTDTHAARVVAGTPEPQTAEAQQQILLAQHAKDVNDVIELGQTVFGTAHFDEASAVVAAKLGGKTQEFMAIAKQFDRPHELVNHLANNPAQLEALAKLSPARQIVELGRIESRMAPHGHVSTGADPAWKSPAARTGRVSDVDWKQNFGANLDDARWNKEFDRRQAERNKRR